MRYVLLAFLAGCSHAKPIYHTDGFSDVYPKYQCKADEKVLLECDGAIDASECTTYCEAVQKQ